VPYIARVESPERSSSTSSSPHRERGQRDDRERLRLQLPEAPTEYLEGALDNAGLGPEEIAILLRNRAATGEIVARIGRTRSWMSVRDVRVAFVRNPRAPHVLARQVLPHLFCRDLSELAADLRVSPVVRRDAEKLLSVRLPGLSLGERVALARRGSRGIVEVLRNETEAMVLRALACNPHATEADITRILSRPDVPAEFLGWLADQSHWGQRGALRSALVRHPRTPTVAALHLIQALARRELDELLSDSGAPRVVRVAAERRLATARVAFGDSCPHFG
jgi:hypothetical protein